MEIIRSLDNLGAESPSVVTVGVFDGVHVGHQAIMRIVKADAAELAARSVVVTFDRHPEELVSPDMDIPYITTLQQKIDLISAQEMDIALVLPLEHWIMDMTAEEFATDVLHNRLKALQVVVGKNFVFGKGRSGNVRVLRQLGDRLGFQVVAVSPIKLDDLLVSSTAIRRLLANGRIEKANVLLGHPFALVGQVGEGDRLGRELGFPTANIESVEDQIIPASGVYAVSVKLGNSELAGVANIGVRPTIGGGKVRVEVHIVGFSGDLYGSVIEIMFHHRLREEVRFPDVDALRAQIARDIEQTTRLLG